MARMLTRNFIEPMRLCRRTVRRQSRAPHRRRGQIVGGLFSLILRLRRKLNTMRAQNNSDHRFGV